MGNEIEIAVIAGLAVGIAFVLLFSFYFPSFRDVVTGTTSGGGITISLEDLKDQYPLSEPLNFTVTAKGRGALCDHPTVKILYAKSGEVAYDFPNLDVVYECSPDPVDHDITWRLTSMMDPYSPLLIGELGHYILKVELSGVVLKKDFIIYDEITYIPKRDLTLQAGNTMLPEAEGAATCGESLEHVKSVVGIPVRTPTVLPEGYTLKAVDLSPPDTVLMKYSDRPVCGGDGMKLRDGVLELNEGPLSALTTEKSGADYIKQQLPKYEASQMDAKTYEFANGMIAIGYPAGLGTSEAIDENNEVVHTEQHNYAADLWVFDDESHTIYYFKAFMPLEDLVRIAESLQ